MAFSAKRAVAVEEVTEMLVNYSMDRNELNILLKSLPQDEAINPVTVEYEIQLLKILSVGWGISYFMIQHPKKKELTEAFWNSIRDVSRKISSVTSASIGKDIDYFGILKKRLDIYVKALNQNPNVTDPVHVICPIFAEFCKNKSNPHVILAGSKAFSLSLSGVKAYLDSIEIV